VSEQIGSDRRPVRVCHINLYRTALWRDPAQPSQPTGGAELQQAMIARAAARRGWIRRSSRWTSVKARNRGRPLRILAAYRREQGLPGLRFFILG